METEKIKRIKSKRKSFDFILFLACFLVLMMGLIFVYSASYPTAIKEGMGGSYYLSQHIKFLVIGFFAMTVGYLVDLRIFAPSKKTSRYYYDKRGRRVKISRGFVINLSFILFLITLVLVFITPYVGELRKGAIRWIKIAGIQFTSSDTLKVGAILYLSNYLAGIKSVYKNTTENIVKRYIIPILIIIFCSASVYLTRDLGTTLVLMGALGVIYLVSGPSLSVIIMGIMGISMFGILSIKKSKFRSDRIDAYLNPLKHVKDAGWQVTQSLIAYANGGLLGVGLTNGKQKFYYLPEAYTDYILAVIGEESGFFGVLFIILLFSVIILKGYTIAKRANNKFNSYLATGITSLIAFQFILNVGVTMNLLPSKGITLPYISYGGTSLIVFMGLMGLLLNVSKCNNKEVS